MCQQSVEKLCAGRRQLQQRAIDVFDSLNVVDNLCVKQNIRFSLRKSYARTALVYSSHIIGLIQTCRVRGIHNSHCSEQLSHRKRFENEYRLLLGPTHAVLWKLSNTQTQQHYAGIASKLPMLFCTITLSPQQFIDSCNRL